MIEIHTENYSFYRIDIAQHPNNLANETCMNVGHDFVREEHPKIIHFTTDGSVSTLDFFMKFCNICGLQQNFSRISKYDVELIELDNLVESKFDEALETGKRVYFEFENPVEYKNSVKQCVKHNYDTDDANLFSDNKPTDDSWIRRYKFKVKYRVGICQNCNHRFCKITPINIRNSKE